MKQKFLALVEEVRKTGIIEIISKTSNAKELDESWDEFLEKNEELCIKIDGWSDEFIASDEGPIFKKGEELKDPMGIAAVIRIIGKEEVSECEIFEDWSDLSTALKNIEGDFAVGLALNINDTYICDIMADEIFNVVEIPGTEES